MSAHEQMRLMLDKLMGSCRNGENSDGVKLHFTDTRVCKCFLLNCCPYEILAYTRFNLGKCPKVHDVAVKADFEKCREYERVFQVEAYEQLKSFIIECKRRTQVAKLRLASAQDALNSEKFKQLHYVETLDKKINDIIRKAERLGAVGDVEEAFMLTKEVDVLKAQKKKAALHFKNTTPSSHDQQKKLRLCEVCSSYLSLNDDDKRLADHFTGKLHLGFLHIMEKFKELETLIQDNCIKEVLDNEFQSSQSYKRCRSQIFLPAGKSHDEDYHANKRQKS